MSTTQLDIGPAERRETARAAHAAAFGASALRRRTRCKPSPAASRER
jgi:hypothetical protein